MDDPGALRRRDEQATRRGQRDERGACPLGALAADGVAERAEHGAAGRREGRATAAAATPASEPAPVPPRPGDPLALGERLPHDRPRALPVCPRQLDLAQPAAKVFDASGVTTSPRTKADSFAVAFLLGFVFHSRSPRASSARRRRELTVPRGRSSARAISPGV